MSLGNTTMTTTPPIMPTPDDGYLSGQLLIAMPLMRDARFSRTVIYLCAHSQDGAMGLVLNKPTPEISFADLIDRLEIKPDEQEPEPIGLTHDVTVHSGGPVDTGRGFVLHSPDYHADDTTVSIGGDICLTATIDILRAIASGEGPKQLVLALGYAGWSPGQLESEIQGNGWLHCPATPELVFSKNNEAIYDKALAHIGVNPAQLVSDVGHA